MNHLRRFSKSKPTRGVQGGFKSKPLDCSHLLVSASNDTPRLPPELFILIASFVEQDMDLAALCIVSKAFAAFCIPMLYKTIFIEGTQTKLHLRLYHTLQEPRFSNLVTELSVSLHRDSVCGKYNHKGVTLPFRRSCTCNAYDRLLGEAILTLSALESLTLWCTLCRTGHDHGYLLHPQVPMLRRFAFHCYTSGRFSNDLPVKSILLAPFMPKVTALVLECHAAMISSSISLDDQAFIDNPNVAPQLHTLQYATEFARSNLLAGLLAERPIQRLCIDTSTHHSHGAYAHSLQSSLWKSPGTLSHLFSVDLLQWLPRAMTETIKPYRNLKFIGTITGSHTEVSPVYLFPSHTNCDWPG
jgi:F-box-like